MLDQPRCTFPWACTMDSCRYDGRLLPEASQLARMLLDVIIAGARFLELFLRPHPGAPLQVLPILLMICR